MKLIAKIILLITLFIQIPSYSIAQNSNNQGSKIEQNTFATPEKTITYFIENLKNGKLDDAMKACSVEEKSKNFNFTAYTKRLNAFTFRHSPIPSEYDMYVQMNKHLSGALIYNQIKFFIYSLLSKEKMDGTVVASPSEERIQNFITDINPERLKNIEIIKISFPMPSIQNNERYIKNCKNQAVVYGAITATDRIVLYKFEDNYYVGGFYLLKYNNNWKIEHLHSYIANTNILGALEKISPEKFNYIISK